MGLDFALPFTVDQFYGVFAQYNEGVWPMQIVLYAIGIASLFALSQPPPVASRVIAGLLAALWVWMALTYCFLYLTRISVSGWIIGALLLTGGAWLGWTGAIMGRISFGPRGDLQGGIGGLLILYALVVYPLIGLAVGHRYPAMPTFGLPCPITIFTVGMLLFTTRPVPRSMFVVPAAWGLLGGASATILLGVYQDAGLLLAGIISLLASCRIGGTARDRAWPSLKQSVTPASGWRR